jgi:ferredoxin
MKKKKPTPLRTTRRFVQFAFLALTVIAVFTLGANAEVWCPFGGVEALYTYVEDGTMPCSLAVSNFFIMGALLVMALLLRRVFCGYMCPIGFISELLQRGARRLGIKPRMVPGKLDAVLSLLKYPLLVVILYFTWQTAELILRAYDPCYVLISRHGKDITWWAYVVSGVIAIASLFIYVPFCRWLCPLAAVLNPFSRFGLTRVVRHEEICTDCGLCNKACPVQIPVAEVKEVNHARCYSCYDCVEACPPNAKGSLTVESCCGSSRPWSQWKVIGVMLLITAISVGASYVWPLPAYAQEIGDVAENQGEVELGVSGVTCRGSSGRLWEMLKRDDGFGLGEYIRVEAWPGAGFAKVKVFFDADLYDAEKVKQAITTPLVDFETGDWSASGFEVEGYDPYGLDE